MGNRKKKSAASRRRGNGSDERGSVLVPEEDPLAPPPPPSSSAALTVSPRRSSETLAKYSQELETLYQMVDDEVRHDMELDLNDDNDEEPPADSRTRTSPLRNRPQSTIPTPPTSSCTILTGAAANLCSATLGAGVLALPFAMRQAGLVVGLLLLLASAGATVVSIQLLVAAQTAANVSTMEQLVALLLGHRMKVLVEACIVVFCVGCSVSYVIAVGDILYITLGWKRLSSMLAVWSVLMMPLSMVRHMRSFQWTSGTGVAAIGTLIFSAFLHLVNDDFGQQHGNHSRWDTNDTWLEDKMYGPFVADLGGNTTIANEPVYLRDYLWPENGIISVLKACPIVMFAFSCQINVPSIYHELNDPAIMQKVAYLSVTVCFLLYASISIIALADFGELIEPNILVNYKHDSGMMQFATASMAAAVITAFPLNVFPARLAIIGVWRRYLAQRSRPASYTPNETLTAALLEDQDGDDASAGSEGSQYGTIGRSLSLDVASDRDDGLMQRENGDASPSNDEDNDEGSFNLQQHVVVTLLLTGIALVCAILVPDISIVFGLLGGTTTSVLGFIVPGALALRLNDRRLVCVASIILVGGILISILTTSVTIFSTVTGSI